jgi:hypothetical protein
LDERRSQLVETVTFPPAVAVEPIIKPIRVTVTAALAESVAFPVDMNMEVALRAIVERVAPPDNNIVGVGLTEKKPDG